MPDTLPTPIWQLSPPASLDELVMLMQRWEVSPLLAQVLHGRDFSSELFATPLQLTPNSGLTEAAQRLIEAIEQKKRIRIHGDYDADGVTATATLVRGLQALGADVHGFIPRRLHEGYGIHPDKVHEHAEQADLLVTVDCGVTNLPEVEQMLALGLEVIITDHHAPGPSFPKCLVVHPQLTENYNAEIHNLTGAGVAYHLLWAVHQELGKAEPREFLALATIGTVADVAPLLGENRALVKAGLSELGHSKWAGVKALLAKTLGNNTATEPTSKEPTAKDVAFMIAPRINAAGRMGEADLALELLLTDDAKRADELAEHLEERNKERRQIQDDMYEQALELVDPESPAIVITHPDWHAGVMGIVASKLLETFYKPVYIMAAGKGSVRSTAGISAVQGLRHCHDLLKRYGGHMGAAGFSFDESRFDELKQRINEYVAGFSKPVPQICLDAPLPLEGINNALLEQLQAFEPCGEGNPSPCWHIRTIPHSIRRVGKKSEHLQFQIGENIKGIKFAETDDQREYMHDFGVSVMANEWKGTTKTELMVSEGGLRAATPLDLMKSARKPVQSVQSAKKFKRLRPQDAMRSMQQSPAQGTDIWAYARPEVAQFLRARVPTAQIYEAGTQFLGHRGQTQLVLFNLPPAELLREWLLCDQIAQLDFAFGPKTLQALEQSLGTEHLQRQNTPTECLSAATAYHRWQWAHAYQVLSDEGWERAVWALAGVEPVAEASV